MIIARTTFNLHFGQAKPSIALWKEIMDAGKGKIDAPGMRLASDVSGPNYTLVLDLNLRSFMDFGPTSHVWGTNEKIRELYPKFLPLCSSSTSELYHVEHQVGELPPVGHINESMTFHLKFGQARAACAIWKRIMDAVKGEGGHMRLLTDVTGDSYTLILEMSYRSMMEYGPHMHAWMTNEAHKEHYAQFVPLCDRSRRTLYKVEHVV